MAESQGNIDSALSIIAANESTLAVTGSRSTVNQINWALDYEFSRGGFLKGTRLGLNGNWRENYNIELIGSDIFKGGATHPVSAYVIHRRDVFGRACIFRLGLSNLIDLENNDDIRVDGVVRTDANGVPTDYTYRYVTPISANFSVTIDF